MRAITLLLVSCGFLAAQTHRLTLEDIVSVEGIGETALSPDGKTFAMTRGGQIVLMPSEGGWLTPLTSTAGGKTGLSWSPDGRIIAYASQGGIWVVAANGGAPKRLTNAAAGPGDPRQATDRQPQWSPKGHWILFETGRRGHNNMMVVSDDGMSQDYLTAANADEEAASWSPDGTRISYTERSPQTFSGKLNVVKFDAAKGTASDAATLYKAKTDRGGGWSVGKAHWSPDGKSLAVVLQESGWNNVYLIPAGGGAPKALTHGEWEDSNPTFSPDGKSIAVISNREKPEESHVWIVPVDGGSAKRLAQFAQPGLDSSPEWSADGARIYFHHVSPSTTADLVEASLKGDVKFLSHTTPLNFSGDALVAPEVVHYTSKDGTKIAAMLYKPRNAKKGPGVLWIHGGPEGQDTFRLDGWAQYLAQQGYVVLEPNYRGSSGYGEKFRNMNVEESGNGEMDDVAAGANYLVAQGLADP